MRPRVVGSRCILALAVALLAQSCGDVAGDAILLAAQETSPAGGGSGDAAVAGSGGGGGGGELCTDECQWAGNGECDDGGPGAVRAVCPLGTDCTDCGPRGSGGSGGSSGAGSCRLTLAGATGSEPDGQIPVCCTPTSSEKASIDEVFNLLNAYRVANGVSALAYSDLLEETIQGHCRHMVAHPFFDDLAPESAVSTLGARAAQCSTTARAEIIAWGDLTLDALMDGWKGDREINSILLDGSYGRVGLGEHQSYWGGLFDY